MVLYHFTVLSDDFDILKYPWIGLIIKSQLRKDYNQLAHR